MWDIALSLKRLVECHYSRLIDRDRNESSTDPRQMYWVRAGLGREAMMLKDANWIKQDEGFYHVGFRPSWIKWQNCTKETMNTEVRCGNALCEECIELSRHSKQSFNNICNLRKAVWKFYHKNQVHTNYLEGEITNSYLNSVSPERVQRTRNRRKTFQGLIHPPPLSKTAKCVSVCVYWWCFKVKCELSGMVMCTWLKRTNTLREH